MSVKMVLFDLDATLLPMDQDLYIKTYLTEMAKFMAPYGYDIKEFMDVMYKGTGAMIYNDGSRTNEEAFWQVFTGHYGPESRSA